MSCPTCGAEPGALSPAIIDYCAAEVARQRASPRAVGWMCRAWVRALHEWEEQHPFPRLSPEQVEQWGRLVEPEANAGGFRRCAVGIGDRLPPSWDEVPRLVAQLLQPDNLRALGPAHAYREFEEIHPFRDGNGRTGKILYNWLRGSLGAPAMPPNFWGVENP